MAAEEWVAGTGRKGGEQDGEGEAEEKVVKLIRSPPRVFVVVRHFWRPGIWERRGNEERRMGSGWIVFSDQSR